MLVHEIIREKNELILISPEGLVDRRKIVPNSIQIIQTENILNMLYYLIDETQKQLEYEEIESLGDAKNYFYKIVFFSVAGITLLSDAGSLIPKVFDGTLENVLSVATGVTGGYFVFVSLVGLSLLKNEVMEPRKRIKQYEEYLKVAKTRIAYEEEKLVTLPYMEEAKKIEKHLHMYLDVDEKLWEVNKEIEIISKSQNFLQILKRIGQLEWYLKENYNIYDEDIIAMYKGVLERLKNNNKEERKILIKTTNKGRV